MLKSLLLFAVFSFFIVAGFSSTAFLGMGYIWVDIIRPQQITYGVFPNVRLSLIIGVTLIILYIFKKKKHKPNFTSIQCLLVILAIWVSITTIFAHFPSHAWVKWDGAFKSILFATFLPYIFRSRLEIESALLTFNFSVSFYYIGNAYKTVVGGGSYGSSFIETNSQISESSTLALVCVMLIPINLYMSKYSIIFSGFWGRRYLFWGCALCNLITTIGNEARTGLVALVALSILYFLFEPKGRIRTLLLVTLVGALILNFASESWLQRMETIETHEQDSSAAGRLGVWKATLDFVEKNPFGGGFGAYRANESVSFMGSAPVIKAYHSIYFEVLGEHGYLGLGIYFLIYILAVTKARSMYITIKREYKIHWFSELSKSLFLSTSVFLIGGAFIGIAFQPIGYFFVAMVICQSNYLKFSENEKISGNKT